jgi:methylenetetrahydrofolate dehydrogenase (NADP+)/methenyltetrahydrofolate cyclohydrolase
MVHIFEGKKFAEEKLEVLSSEARLLRKKGIRPKFVSILIGDNPGSVMYTNLKKRAAERIGCQLSVISYHGVTSSAYQPSVEKKEIIKKIEELNRDTTTHGIMIQLPFPDNFEARSKKEIINAITNEKDVDGMRDDSLFTTPVVKAVLYALEDAETFVRQPLRGNPYKVVVVGAEGFEGRKIVEVLKIEGYEVEGVDIETTDLRSKTKDADILVCATGVAGLIRGNMVKEGCVVIDIGAPKGDVEFESVSKKAEFITPVPGGIGPVTIVALLENLVEASKNAIAN